MTRAEDLEAAIAMAADLQTEADRQRDYRERSRAERVSRIIANPGGFDLLLGLTDEVMRVRQPERAAKLLSDLVDGAGGGLSAFGPIDRAALRAGARLGPLVPRLVVPAARRRVRSELGDVILPAGDRQLARHARRRREQGIRLNVNVLGEAILGDDEALRRLDRIKGVLRHPDVDYVSVKISSVCAQLEVLRFDHEVERIAGPLRELYDLAASYTPAKFVNLDMEEYRDLELTLAVFKKVLDEPAYERLGAGVVLQAYLPDSLPALEELCAWARRRRDRAGGWVKVRIVKGANLAAERVDAEMHGWEQAPFSEKVDTDANYKRMLEVALDPVNDGAVRVGVASHNLFELGWAATRAERLGAFDRVEFEMLEGMSPAVASSAAVRFGGLLLYAPIVDPSDLESAIAYLVRRLDENTTADNFLAHQFGLSVGSGVWEEEAERFRRAVKASDSPPAVRSRRTQDRSLAVRAGAGPEFANEPDTDFTVAANRRWIEECLGSFGFGEHGPSGGEPQEGIDPSRPGAGAAYRWWSAGEAEVSFALDRARGAVSSWAGLGASGRRRVLHDVADGLARARGRLLAVMAYDTGKTVREGDPEVSEAVDFAAYYASCIPDDGSGFRPYGVVTVASPWNFPLSIPAGGVLAALAAGNAVILKPAPEAVAVAGELVRVMWDAGVPGDVLQFVPCVDGPTSSRLITDDRVDAVVLTGSWETAQLFLQWRPGLNLHAETSGKNAIVVTATADLDEAVADVVHSAFGHAGQKCSAASLLIVEAAVHDDPRFLPRLADAVRSLVVGPAWDLRTNMGPLIRPPTGPLLDAFSRLDSGERWLVEPAPLDPERYLWSPGVKVGVQPGSPFHMTECFGPVLGVMRARDVDEAVRLQNAPAYGLTAGLHALDPLEIAWWRDRVQAGNLYVNRGITGAIVRRQPFGGWKHSVVGAGAKAGGPNYVASLGSWPAVDNSAVSVDSYRSQCARAWQAMRSPVDFTGMAAESNAFRYVPLRSVLLCAGPDVQDAEVELAVAAGSVCGVTVRVHRSDSPIAGDVDKVRLLGSVDDSVRLAAHQAGMWVDDIPVAADPHREMLRWVREQAVSETRHRHGNVTARRPGLVPLAVRE
jgi:RHH-type proline utilization regulon transcriptional repressor/proline dehydrogenase/delta 1-pyrroline-5-carboxylate dehydrogenase